MYFTQHEFVYAASIVPMLKIAVYRQNGDYYGRCNSYRNIDMCRISDYKKLS